MQKKTKLTVEEQEELDNEKHPRMNYEDLNLPDNAVIEGAMIYVPDETEETEEAKDASMKDKIAVVDAEVSYVMEDGSVITEDTVVVKYKEDVENNLIN